MVSSIQEKKKLRMDPRIRERRLAVSRSKARKRLYLILALLVVLAGYLSGYEGLRSSLFSVKTIEVSGSSHYTKAALIHQSGVQIGSPLTEVNPVLVAKRLGSLPWNGPVIVSKKWPNRLVIRVSERIPVGVVPESGQALLLVDRFGRVLQNESSANSHNWIRLCLVRSITSSKDLSPNSLCPAQSTIPGAFLPSQFGPLLSLAWALHSNPVASFSELAMSSSGELDGELTSGLAVRFGTLSQLSQKLRALQLLLSQASTAGYSTIDLTVPHAPVLSNW